MKTKLFFSILVLTLSFTVNAQLPNFIKIDTGAITIMPGGHGSSTCFDMDNDGDMDIATMNSGTFIARDFSIYKNERNGFFIKIPNFIDIPYSHNLSSFGDMDNDGDIDLFTGLPNVRSNYFVNDGYGNYQYDTTIFLAAASFYPSLIDLNNDGYLDVVGIDRNGSITYNDGSGGFLDKTYLGLLQEQTGVLLHGMSWGDPDDDGDYDFYAGYSANQDGGISVNICFMNDGSGGFIKFDETSVIVEDTCGTSCANWVDYDNDGDMDIYIHNGMCDNTLPALYENLGDMQFAKHVFLDEIYRYSLASGGVWGDLDNDADLDFYMAIENNRFLGVGDTSATPYNVIYLNDGNGQFSNILNHPLALEDSHTALMFDHDNDGDLDVLLSRYGWVNTGHNNLFVNEGNDNSWMILTCEGTRSNRTAIGARVQAKAFVNGKHITQTREITPINGHLSYADLRVHFGFGNTDVIDTLLIRWPSGQVDEYLDVQTNQFYRAIEDSTLKIDFNATNYIQFSPRIANLDLVGTGQSTTIDLSEHYHFMKGDTVPAIRGDTLIYSIYNNEHSDTVQATLVGSILTLEALANTGSSKIQLIASAGFTERMDSFIVYIGQSSVPSNSNLKDLKIYPNPAHQELNISAKGSTIEEVSIYSITGQRIIQVGPINGKVDISHLKPGMYILEVMIENTRVRQKLVVE